MLATGVDPEINKKEIIRKQAGKISFEALTVRWHASAENTEKKVPKAWAAAKRRRDLLIAAMGKLEASAVRSSEGAGGEPPEATPDSVAGIVATVLHAMDGDDAVVSPAVWQPNADGGKRWYFMIAVSRRGKLLDMQILISNPPQQLPPGLSDFVLYLSKADDRTMIMNALSAARPSIVLHDMNSELEAVRRCEQLWPSERTTQPDLT